MSDSVGNQKKIHVINMKVRQAWSKYDKDSRQIIYDKANIIKIIQQSFTDAMLKSDFDNLIAQQQNKSLEKLIYEEAKLFDYDKVMRDQKGTDMNINLNHEQVMNIIKRLYNDPSAVQPQGSFTYPSRQSKFPHSQSAGKPK
jgi:hypothetical protein